MSGDSIAPDAVDAPSGSVDLSVTLGPLELNNPILTASGTFGYGLEFSPLTDLNRYGGLVTKGLSLEPIAGNRAPRICEVRGGMLNSIGLQNIGIESFLADVLPGLSDYPAAVVVNLFGYTEREYVQLAKRVDGVSGVAAAELNVSCPNVKRGGIQFGHDSEMLYRLVSEVRAATTKPLAVKLSPNVTHPIDLALAAQKAGADILSAINTVVGMSIDTRTHKPRLATIKGGLSGPAIRPIAVRIVFDVAREVDLPVIGIGGIETVDDVLEFLLAGASAVQIGTTLFRDPQSGPRLVDELDRHLLEREIKSVRDLIGAVEISE